MSIWIRKEIEGQTENYKHIAQDEWSLPKLFAKFEEWLGSDESQLDPAYQWVVDIGFEPRENALGGGPIISKELMKVCVAKNISIYLSEYGS